MGSKPLEHVEAAVQPEALERRVCGPPRVTPIRLWVAPPKEGVVLEHPPSIAHPACLGSLMAERAIDRAGRAGPIHVP